MHTKHTKGLDLTKQLIPERHSIMQQLAQHGARVRTVELNSADYRWWSWLQNADLIQFAQGSKNGFMFTVKGIEYCRLHEIEVRE